MSDTFDGVVVEYFDVDHEIAQQKHFEAINSDIDAQMDDDSGTGPDWGEMYEQQFYNGLED